MVSDLHNDAMLITQRHCGFHTCHGWHTISACVCSPAVDFMFTMDHACCAVQKANEKLAAMAPKAPAAAPAASKSVMGFGISPGACVVMQAMRRRLWLRV